jgi:hypothetical protein
VTIPTIRVLCLPEIGMNLHPGCGCTAMAGTADTPIPADTIASIVANCPLSKTMLGDILNL